MPAILMLDGFAPPSFTNDQQITWATERAAAGQPILNGETFFDVELGLPVVNTPAGWKPLRSDIDLQGAYILNTLPVEHGGTGGTDQASALSGLGAAASVHTHVTTDVTDLGPDLYTVTAGTNVTVVLDETLKTATISSTGGAELPIASADVAVDTTGMIYLGDGTGNINELDALVADLNEKIGFRVPYGAYDEQTVIIAIAEDTPIPLTIAEGGVLGRMPGGNLKSLTTTEQRTNVGIPNHQMIVVDTDGDISLPEMALSGASLFGGRVQGSQLDIAGTIYPNTESPGVTQDSAAIGVATSIRVAKNIVLQSAGTGVDGLTVTTTDFIGPRAQVQVEGSIQAVLNTRALMATPVFQDQMTYGNITDSENLAIPFTLTNAVANGTTATITTNNVNHRIPVGASVTIRNCSDTNYNGTYTVTARTGNTVTFNKSYTASSAAVTGQLVTNIVRAGLSMSYIASPAFWAGGGTAAFDKFGTEFSLANEQFSVNPALWALDGGHYDIDPEEGLLGIRDYTFLINANPVQDVLDLTVPWKRTLWINRVSINGAALLAQQQGILIDPLDAALASYGIENNSRYNTPSRRYHCAPGVGDGSYVVLQTFRHSIPVGSRIKVYNASPGDNAVEGTYTTVSIATADPDDSEEYDPTTSIAFASTFTGDIERCDVCIVQRVAAGNSIDTSAEMVYIESTSGATMDATNPLSTSAFDGQRLTVHNIGSFTIRLPVGGNLVSFTSFEVDIVPGGFATFHYRGYEGKWRLVHTSGNTALGFASTVNAYRVYANATHAEPVLNVTQAFGVPFIQMGPGDATEVDTTITRYAAGIVEIQNHLRVQDVQLQGDVYLAGRTVGHEDIAHGFLRRRYVEDVEEFLTTGITNGTIGKWQWNTTVVNSGTIAASSGLSLGGYLIGTGTASATGSSGLMTSWLINAGFGYADFVYETRVAPVALSTAGQEASYNIGIGDSVTAEPTNGIYFRYDRLTSVNWLICTANGGARTRTDSGIAVSINPKRLRIKTVSGSARFFIDDVECTGSPQSTNFPAAPQLASAPIYSVIKSAGTGTARQLNIDYASLLYKHSR